MRKKELLAIEKKELWVGEKNADLAFKSLFWAQKHEAKT